MSVDNLVPFKRNQVKLNYDYLNLWFKNCMDCLTQIRKEKLDYYLLVITCYLGLAAWPNTIKNY